MTNRCVILAGGFGTRLKSVVDDRPKVMALVNGRPFLEYQIEYLRQQQITEFVLSTGYKGEMVQEHFSTWGSAEEFETTTQIQITFSHESSPLGTGGAILQAISGLEGALFVLNGDSFFDISLQRMWEVWVRETPKLVMALREADDVSRFGAVDLDNHGRIRAFSEKGSHTGAGLINGGVYLFDAAWLRAQAPSTVFSFEKDVLEQCAGQQHLVGVPFSNYFIDIGVPTEYERAQHDFTKR
jgi:D-glycero-alpha-D-manno-heptose 1-phosphate guanylyltransferase